jgi:tetratricopeptide (TPR) repeat protein
MQTAEYADACRFAGRIEESERVFGELLEDAEQKDNRTIVCVARTGLANAFCARSRWEDAVELLRPALEDARASGDRVLRARVECVLASALFNRGELEETKKLLNQALRTAREYEALATEVAALTSLGIASLAVDDTAAAFTHLSQGIGLAERTHNDHWAVIGRSYLAIQAHLSGQLAAAGEMYELSLSELESLGIRRALGVCRYASATLWMLRADWDRARVVLEQAMTELAVTCPDYEPILHPALALCDLGADRTGAAQRLAHAKKLCGGDDVRPAFADIVRRIEELDAVSRDKPAKEVIEGIEGLLIERVCQALRDKKTAGNLYLSEDGSQCRVSGTKTAIDLSRRLPLQRMLRALVAEHEKPAATHLTEDELVRAVWPGERIAARAARIRLHTTVSMLRKMGLGALIERSTEGYRLRPGLSIRRTADLSGFK